jgi:HK97 family phage prohead protease
MSDLIAVDKFRQAARAGKKPDAAVFRVSVGDTVTLEGDRRAVRFCFSDGSVDRMGDTIAADGWETTSFSKNPVALWAHDSSQPPIGRASNIAVENARLMGDIEFMEADLYPFADLIYRMVQGKYISAVSVGFMPLDYDFADDSARQRGIDFKRQELLEISVCPVPANANALIDARAKGIDTRPLVEWAEKMLDGGGRVILPKAELQRLRDAAKEPKFRLDPKIVGESEQNIRDIAGVLVMATKPKSTKPQRRDTDVDPLDSTDIPGDGDVMGNCGRQPGEECGMKNSEECMVHKSDLPDDGTNPMDEKRLQVMIDKAIAAALRRFAAKRVVVRDADGDTDDDTPGHEEEFRSAHMHFKMAQDCYDAGDDLHDKGMKCMKRGLKAMDENGVENEPEPEVEPKPEEKDDEPADDDAVAKAKARARVRTLLAAA